MFGGKVHMGIENKVKLWVCSEVDENSAKELAVKTGISQLLAAVLLNRGITSPEKINLFLNPTLSQLHDPFLLNDMDKAITRICKAVNNQEKIYIYGDYDVDGVTSSSVLYNFFSSIGIEVGVYIPDRLDEGYGLSVYALDKIVSLGAQLIITVDCGITAFAEVEHVKSCGLDIIITDHHECHGELPSAYAVINPHRHDSTYPFKELAGVGVAFKVICALCSQMGLGDRYLEFIDLVALGTVADVVSLLDENRVIVKFGIEKMNAYPNEGIKALLQVAGVADKPINTVSIGYMLAPRINAAGRLGAATRAVELFTARDTEQVAKIANELNEKNKSRQQTELEILTQVIAVIEADPKMLEHQVLVVSGKEWHHGVIGIVASKISEKYYRPCFLLCEEEGYAKGSGRSVEGFNLFDALNHCGHLLVKYGGHEQAAGLSIKVENLAEFKETINAYAAEILKDIELKPCVKIDKYITKQDLNLETVKELEKLAPFGTGNPSPLFACNSLKIRDIRTVGDNKHLKLMLHGDGFAADAIGFSMGKYGEVLNQEDVLEAVFSLEINTWNSISKVQFNLRDLRQSEGAEILRQYFIDLDKNIVFGESKNYNINIDYNIVPVTALVPERNDFAAVYRYIKQPGAENIAVDDLFVFAEGIAQAYNLQMNYFKVKRCIEIFHELGLIEVLALGEFGVRIIIPQNAPSKVELEQSNIYRKLQNLLKLA